MAKEFIRHLEYYGFPDQNVFLSEGSVDLDPIHHKDAKQDHEIHELFKRTHMLKDWNIKQDKGIEDLTTQYNNIADTVFEHEDDINAISGTVDDIVAAIGGFPFPQINEEIEEISGNVIDLSSKVEDNHSEFLDYSATTAQYLKDYSEWVDLRYAHQDNTYTKDEVDAKISGGVEGYATEEWVKSQNYLTEDSGNTLYVRLDTFNPYSAATKTAIDDVATSASTLKNEIHVLDEKVDDYHAQVEDYISQTQALNARVGSAETRIGIAEVNINTINTILPSKANSATVETYVTTLNGRIDGLSSATDIKLATKVDNTTYNTFTANTTAEISDLGNNKATKTEAATLSAMVTTEEAARIAGDAALQAQIVTISSNTIPNIEQLIVEANDHTDEVHDEVTAETAARIQGDLDLIGNSSDIYTANTINGAKAEALRQATSAYTSATQYADSVGTNIRTVDLVNLRNDFNTAIGTKASSADLTAAINSITNSYEAADNILKSDLLVQLTSESNQRANDDNDLSLRINTNASSITNLGNRLIQRENELNVIHPALHDLIDYLKSTGVLPSNFHPEV